MSTLDTTQLDRAAGTLLGTAVGDALGAGYEFGTARLGDGPARMIGGGLGNFAPGEWTDDTTMAVCIAEIAATGADLTQAAALTAIGERFLDWARSNPPDIGISTAGVLRGASKGTELAERARAYLARTGRGGGNGALMRTAPVALAHLGRAAPTKQAASPRARDAAAASSPGDLPVLDSPGSTSGSSLRGSLAAAARAVAELTHADPHAGDSCVLWCAAIDQAVRTGRLDGPRVGLDLLPPDRRNEWEAWIDEAEAAGRTGGQGRFRPNGYTVTALQAAWAAIVAAAVSLNESTGDDWTAGGEGGRTREVMRGKGPDSLSVATLVDRAGPAHLEATLQHAIAIGDDTDTVAAIAGALVGARWGASTVPLRHQAIVHGLIPGQAGTRMDAADLRRLAVHTATGGRDDRAGWPGADDLLPHYRRSWPADPWWAPATDEPRLVLGNVFALANVEADAFVSLCRIGGAQRRATDHVEVHLIDHADRRHNPNLDAVLVDTVDLVDGWLTDGRTVFLHCVAGHSRTPTVAALVLARRQGVPALDALACLQTQLPNLAPNPTFIEVLGRPGPPATPRDRATS
jgi:ADP-ribosyl-[dinitrogen reductase] hydrolase